MPCIALRRLDLPNRTRQPGTALTARLSACRKKIQDLSVDGYLVTSRTDQYYLTHFDGEDGAALILPHRVWLITDGRFKDEAREYAPWVGSLVRTGSLIEAITRLAKKHRIARLGFQPGPMTVEMHAKRRRAIRPTQLGALPQIARQLRVHKDS